MNKITFSALVLVIGIVGHCAAVGENYSDAEIKELVKKITEECIKEGKLNNIEIARITTNELFDPKHKDTSNNLKCFLVCYYKKIDILDADGKLKPANFMKYMESRFASVKDKIKPALEKCQNIKDANPCENIYKMEECMIKNLI